jgi:hypothetical protein
MAKITFWPLDRDRDQIMHWTAASVSPGRDLQFVFSHYCNK